LKFLFGVVWVGWIVTVSANALNIAFLVHDLAVFVGCFVGIQVDRLLADRAGKLSFPRSGRYAHGDLISAYAESLPPMLYILRDSFGFFAHEQCLKGAAQKDKKKRA
jgi:hypothetical protein